MHLVGPYWPVLFPLVLRGRDWGCLKCYAGTHNRFPPVLCKLRCVLYFCRKYFGICEGFTMEMCLGIEGDLWWERGGHVGIEVR